MGWRKAKKIKCGGKMGEKIEHKAPFGKGSPFFYIKHVIKILNIASLAWWLLPA